MISKADVRDITSSSSKIEKVKRPQKMILSFNLIKYVNTINMIFLHMFLKHKDEALLHIPENFYPNTEDHMKVHFQIATYIGSWAAMFFYLPSAIVNSYSFVRRIRSKRNSIYQMLIAGLVKGSVYITWHFAFRMLFHQESGYIISYVLNDPESWPIWKPLSNEMIKFGLIFNDALVLNGFNYFFTTIIYAILFSVNNQDKQFKSKYFYYFILLVLGNLVLFGSLFLPHLIYPMVQNFKANDNNVLAFLFNMLTGRAQPGIPFFAHALFGSIFGMGLALHEEFKKLFKVLASFASFWFCFGAIGLWMFFEGRLYGGLMMEDSKRAMIFRSLLWINQYGAGMITIMLMYYCIDIWISIRSKKKVSNFLSYFHEIGKFTMTIYSFEALVKLLFRIPFDFIWNWEDSKVGCVIVGIPFTFMFILISKYWKKYKFIFSFEWTLSKIIYYTSGKKSSSY